MSILARVRQLADLWRRRQLTICRREYEYRHYLKEMWEPSSQAPLAPDVLEEPARQTAHDDTAFSRRPPPPLDWKIAFTATFSKAISTVDRSMQGRVLLALAELSSDPATARGDTVKPLVGDKRGLWRYRLGDYRLVYEPDANDRMVVLMDFAPRGGVYE